MSIRVKESYLIPLKFFDGNALIVMDCWGFYNEKTRKRWIKELIDNRVELHAVNKELVMRNTEESKQRIKQALTNTFNTYCIENKVNPDGILGEIGYFSIEGEGSNIDVKFELTTTLKWKIQETLQRLLRE